jgi:hypothetical protein
MSRLLCLLTLTLTLALPGVSRAEETDWAPVLGKAWTWMEAGALDRADAAFKEVVADPKGRLVAEAYFGLAAVWWQKRNAMASYQRLLEAKSLSNSIGWDAGEGGTWDGRIASRMEYIERNFTVVKLRASSKASVAPLPDPRPRDPLLKEFAMGLEGTVNDALAEGSLVSWLLLPNGTYWVGDELKTLEGGEMDPSRAFEWELDRGARARATYKERFEAIEAGGSPAEAYVGRDTSDPSSRSTASVVKVMHRSIGVGLQGGLAMARALDGLDGSVAPDWTLGLMLEGRLALPPPILALSVSGGWKVLPVNGCRAAPTRAHLISLGVGPSVQVPIDANASLGLDVAFRGGLALGGRNDGARLSCVEKLAGVGDGAVVRGAVADSGDVSSSFGLADLGWQGRAGALGGELAVGPILDGGGPLAFSVQLHVGYDHLIPLLPADAPETVYLRDPRTGDTAAITRAQAVSAASMGRVQIGARVRVLF